MIKNNQLDYFHQALHKYSEIKLEIGKAWVSFTIALEYFDNYKYSDGQ